MKTGILLTAFGSGTAQTENALRLVEDRVRVRFAGLPVRLAFTSPIMRERLAGQWKKSDSVAKALHKMAFERFTRIAVQPLQLVPGVEYGEVAEDTRTVAEALAPEVRIRLGAPLLDEHADLTQVARALIASLPSARLPSESVLFMGHGSRHPSEARYTALAETMTALDSHVFLATMKGGVRLEHVLPSLQACVADKARTHQLPLEVSPRVLLLPLLAAVGRHALDDMAGEGPESWRSRLAAVGIDSKPVLHGLIEYPACIELWLDRLATALADLKNTEELA